jgi:hypothetical protein
MRAKIGTQKANEARNIKRGGLAPEPETNSSKKKPDLKYRLIRGLIIEGIYYLSQIIER